ncbi:hypothetical protein QQX98_011462 [Neonectria punicea]|uniref:JmjC domain-containing protein n=1 Tax=Neonectria punicea TaxID=979145 RepID=A0ABR1GLY5_9HYPO
MFIECAEYKTWKAGKNPTESTGLKEDEVAQWDRFTTVVKHGSDTHARCLGALKTVSRHWGREMVQHYEWASKGAKYCEVLCSAVRQVLNRDEAVTKLSRLMLQRSKLPRRRPLRDSVNPIDQVDLVNLKAWPHKDPFINDKYLDEPPLPCEPLTAEDLPDGFGFDKFGLMVRKEHAVPRPETIGPDTMDLSRSDGTNTVDAQESAASGEAGQTDSALNNTLMEFVDTVLAEAENDVYGTNGDHHAATQATAPAIPQLTGYAVTNDAGDVNGALDDHAGRTLRRRAQKLSYREPAGGVGASKSKHLPSGSVNVAKILQRQRRCCPSEVPAEFLSVLDNSSAFRVELAMQYTPYLKQLCYQHLQKTAELAFTQRRDASAGAGDSNADPLPGTIDPLKPTPARRRAASLPDISQVPLSKRQRLDGPHSVPTEAGGRPMRDRVGDHAYLGQVRAELQEKFKRMCVILNSHGEENDKLIYTILQRIEQPNTDRNRGVVEAFFSTANEAASQIEAGFPDGPIFTQGQQQFQWGNQGRPVAQLFRRMEDLDRTVSVQIPSRSCNLKSFEKRKLSQVYRRFLDKKETDDPWNILDLRSPLPPSTFPSFLTGENCQLLPRIRDAVLMGSSAERPVASREEWNTWRDVLDGVLLSEGGHNTAPHIDSHGLATWITAQEGRLGFCWMSCPTQEERDKWMADPQHFTGGRWKYVIIQPGYTVAFGPGTIHSVVRLRDEQTLALTGHFLQWSGLDRWMQVVIAQIRNPSITNEDMKWDAPKYVRVVAELVRKRIRGGRVEELGGEAAATRFFDLVKEFEKLQQPLA